MKLNNFYWLLIGMNIANVAYAMRNMDFWKIGIAFVGIVVCSIGLNRLKRNPHLNK